MLNRKVSNRNIEKNNNCNQKKSWVCKWTSKKASASGLRVSVTIYTVIHTWTHTHTTHLSSYKYTYLDVYKIWNFTFIFDSILGQVKVLLLLLLLFCCNCSECVLVFCCGLFNFFISDVCYHRNYSNGCSII